MGFREFFEPFLTMFRTTKNVPEAAKRNKNAICSVLKKLVPPEENLTALEIASGSGLHVAYFAENLPNVTWTPSELNESYLLGIIEQKKDLKNVNEPVVIDISEDVSKWDQPPPAMSYDLILNINMIHISEWSATQGLFSAAGQLLTKNGMLVTYGPYSKNGILKPESNKTFNRYLQDQNSAWGVRDIADLTEEAKEYGLYHAEEFDMPSNNKVLVFRRNTCLG